MFSEFEWNISKGKNRAKVLVLKMDSPQDGNSLGKDEANFLKSRLNKKNFDALVLGQQPSRLFCAGGKLKEQKQAKTKQASLNTQKQIRQVLEQIHTLAVPTCAMVQGDVYGGGVELLSCFDYVISSPHSFFGLWQRKLGVTFGWGGGSRLHQRLSAQQLRQLYLTTKTISAYEAQRLGLIDEVLADTSIEQKAQDWLEQVLSYPQNSLVAYRQMTPSNEVKTFTQLWMGPTHKKVLSRF